MLEAEHRPPTCQSTLGLAEGSVSTSNAWTVFGMIAEAHRGLMQVFISFRMELTSHLMTFQPSAFNNGRAATSDRPTSACRPTGRSCCVCKWRLSNPSERQLRPHRRHCGAGFAAARMNGRYGEARLRSRTAEEGRPRCCLHTAVGCVMLRGEWPGWALCSARPSTVRPSGVRRGLTASAISRGRDPAQA